MENILTIGAQPVLVGMPTDLQLHIYSYLNRHAQLALLNTCISLKQLLAPEWCRNQAETFALGYPQVEVPLCTNKDIANLFVECCIHGKIKAIKQLIAQHPDQLRNYRFRGGMSIADIVSGSTHLEQESIIQVLKVLEKEKFTITENCVKYAARSANISVMHWFIQISKITPGINAVIHSNSVSTLISYTKRISKKPFQFSLCNLVVAIKCHNVDMIIYMLRQPSLHSEIPRIYNYVHADCKKCKHILKAVRKNAWLCAIQKKSTYPDSEPSR